MLFGKKVSDLQSDVVIGENEIAGTLKYVSGYTEFSSTAEEQSGNYLALKVVAEPTDAVTSVEVVGGTKGPVILDSDMNVVLLIRNKDEQRVRISGQVGATTATKMYGLSGLTLETIE